MREKVLSALVAVSMALTWLPAAALASEGGPDRTLSKSKAGLVDPVYGSGDTPGGDDSPVYQIEYEIYGAQIKDKDYQTTYSPKDEEQTISVPELEWTGYTLKGWTYGDDERVQKDTVTIPAGVEENPLWLYAVFEKEGEPGSTVYSISYELAGGSVTRDNPDIYTRSEEEQTLALYDPVRPGYTFRGWTYRDVTSPTRTVTLPAGFSGALTLTANWSYNGGGGSTGGGTSGGGGSSGGGSSGGGGGGSYSITSASKTEHGVVTFNPIHARKGSTVTITAKPDAGYVLESLTVTDEDGTVLTLTPEGGNKYSFVMPDSKVEVEAVFVPREDSTTPSTEPGEPSSLPFTDVASGSWYYDAVQYVYGRGMMNGTSASTFTPDAATTRGMIVTMLYRLENTPQTGASAFQDVASGQYYTQAVSWASENGIVSGYGDGRFGPDDSITREQMAVILYRYAQYKGASTAGAGSLAGFADAGQVGSYAADAMSWAVSVGLINGVGNQTLAPRQSATRAQVAVILMRFCQSMGI